MHYMTNSALYGNHPDVVKYNEENRHDNVVTTCKPHYMSGSATHKNHPDVLNHCNRN